MASATRSRQLVLDGDRDILVSLLTQSDTPTAGFTVRDPDGNPLDISANTFQITAKAEIVMGLVEGDNITPTAAFDPPKANVDLPAVKDPSNRGRFTITIPTDFYNDEIPLFPPGLPRPVAVCYIQHGDTAGGALETDIWMLAIDRGLPSLA